MEGTLNQIHRLKEEINQLEVVEATVREIRLEKEARLHKLSLLNYPNHYVEVAEVSCEEDADIETRIY